MNERIIIDPSVRHGKPVVWGTRVPVYRIIRSLAGRVTPEEVCEEYGIIDADVRAALEYAGELVEAEEAHPLPASYRFTIHHRHRFFQTQ